MIILSKTQRTIKPEQIAEINQHISDALNQWSDITLQSDADEWAYHLNYTKDDLMNALCIFFHVAQSIGIKSGVINTTDLAEAAGVELREAVITLTGIDPSEQ